MVVVVGSNSSSSIGRTEAGSDFVQLSLSFKSYDVVVVVTQI